MNPAFILETALMETLSKLERQEFLTGASLSPCTHMHHTIWHLCVCECMFIPFLLLLRTPEGSHTKAWKVRETLRTKWIRTELGLTLLSLFYVCDMLLTDCFGPRGLLSQDPSPLHSQVRKSSASQHGSLTSQIVFPCSTPSAHEQLL